jgi:transposase
MPRRYGYAQSGKRCVGKHDWQAKGRTNVIGALSGGHLLTTCLYDSYINTQIFCSWLETDLLPKLPENSVIIMDNAAFHKHDTLQCLIEEAGATLEYLPPYSPDLNPIEHKWAQAKAIRRATQCSVDELFFLYSI